MNDERKNDWNELVKAYLDETHPRHAEAWEYMRNKWEE